MTLRSARAAVLGATVSAVLVLAATPARGEPTPTGVVVGAGLGLSTAIGSESAGVGVGFSANPRIGYELPMGLTPMIAATYSVWEAASGSRWELSILPGLRWTILPERFRPWVEGGLGYGQLVHDNDAARGRVDVGLRIEAALGLDYVLAESVRLGIHLAVNQLYGGGSPGYDSTWLDMGAGVTFRPF